MKRDPITAGLDLLMLSATVVGTFASVIAIGEDESAGWPMFAITLCLGLLYFWCRRRFGP